MKFRILMMALSLLFAAGASRAQTDGQVNFQVTTVTDGGTYAPRNVLAIWVTDAQTNFVKTLLVRAVTQKRWLIKWNQHSGGNQVDGISGATRTAHGTTNVSWNCRNVSGSIVADGLYRIMVEFTEWNGQGPYTTAVSFVKGSAAVNLTPANLPRFTGISLSYTPLNAPPELAPIPFQSVIEGQAMTFQVIAQPTGGDAVTLTASNLPAGAQFFPTNSAGTFVWPSAAPAGTYTSRFYAADKDGVTMREAILQVRVPGSTALGAALGSPILLAPSALSQNAAGDNFDMDESGGFATTSDQGGFGDFGRIYVNYDATNLYLAADGVDMVGENNGMILFLGVSSLSDDALNLWSKSGLPNGLDVLSNVRFALPVDMAIVLGDEWGDGQYPNFNLGDGYNFGQGMFYLSATSFVPVSGARLAQYDGTGTQPTSSGNDDGARLTKRWECAIPWTSLNAPQGIDSVSEITLCGVFANSSVSGVTNRYLSANYIGADIIYHDPRDGLNNAAFGAVTITPLSIAPRGGNNIAVTGAGPSVGGAGTVIPLRITVSNLQNATVSFPVSVTNLTAPSARASVTVSNLAERNARELVVMWDSAGLVPGSHLLRITAGPLPGEVYLGDNAFELPVTLRPPIHDLAVESVSAPSWTTPGSSPTVTVALRNLGDYAETARVRLFDATDLVPAGASPDLALDVSASTNISLSWSTSGASLGWHTLSVSAEPVTGETEVANNSAEVRMAVADRLVTNRVLNHGALWRYQEEGLDLFPTPWTATNFYDLHWPSGSAPLGFRLPVATTFSATNHGVYFLRALPYVDVEPVAVTVSLARDDGVALMVDGIELLRDNLATGLLSGTSRAVDAMTGSAQTSRVTHALDPQPWRHGRRTVAVSLHQAGEEANGGHPWINELHYDNNNTDLNEGVEVAGPAGTDLSRYTAYFYRSNGSNYMTTGLSGTLTNQLDGMGARWFGVTGIRNGPDGVALVVDGTGVLEFISYEGVFTATQGPASGMSSVLLPVSEPSSTPLGQSLQRTGSGSMAADFSWTGPATHSRGLINAGQSIAPEAPDLFFDMAIDLVVPELPAVHALSVTEVTPQRDAFSGDAIPVSIRVSNQGNRSESFSVHLVDATTGALMGTATIQDLGSGEEATVTINWLTSGWAAGQHGLTAYVVQGGITNPAGSLTGVGVVAGDGMGVRAVEGTGAIGGGALAVSRQGRWVVLGEGATLSVIDVLVPAAPVRLASIPLPGRIEAVAMAGNWVYTANGSEGVHVIDITDPARPLHRQTVDTPGHASDVLVNGSTLFIADGVSGLRCVDIADPLLPSTLGHLATGGSVRALARSGGLLYLADWFEGLVVVDIANPGAPQRVGSALAAGFGNDAIVQGGEVWIPTAEGRCLRVDVTTPASPVVAGGFVTGAKNRQGAIDGNRLYLAVGSGGLMVYDVSVSTNPVGIAALPGMDASGVAAGDGLVLLADGAGGLRVYDAATQGLLSTVGSAARAVRAAFQGMHLFLATGETGLRIYTLENPALPVLVGSVSAIGNARDVAVAGTLAAVADESGLLRLINIATPSAPLVLGQWPASAAAPLLHVRMVGNRALVAGFDQVWLLDLSNPAAPAVLGTAVMPTRIADIALADGIAAVAAGAEGVYFLDSAGGSLATVGRHLTDGAAESIAVEGSVAWVADDNGARTTLDISQPGSPVVLAGHSAPASLTGLAAGGRYLAAGAGNNEVVLLDRTDVVVPVESARLSNLTDALRLSAGDGHLAILQDDAGAVLASLQGTDTDGDGLDDAWEKLLVDADPNDGVDSILDIHPGDDFDGDGLSNRNEYIAGTSAVDGDSVFVVQSTAGASSWTLTWPSAPGRTYTVLRTDSLAVPFTPVASGVAATPPMNSISYADEGEEASFFMVVAE